MDKNGPPNHQGFQPPPPGFAPPPPYTDGPPHHHMPQQQQPAPNVIIVQQPANFGPDSQAMTCPYCQASISTRVMTDTSTKTHLFALLLCLFGCWPCAPCPYCMDSCLVKKHYCPSCNTYLGMYDN